MKTSIVFKCINYPLDGVTECVYINFYYSRVEKGPADTLINSISINITNRFVSLLPYLFFFYKDFPN